MRYKQSPLWLFVILLTLPLIFNQSFQTLPANTLQKNAEGFAVIELFTSEGCSSCPAADDAVAAFVKANPNDHVYVLSFHVDYWNKLGWKDVYSSAVYTARQNRYASAMKLENIYTPQIIVNGKYEFVGSNRSQLNRVVEKELAGSPGATIKLSIAAANNDRITVIYQLNEKTTANLNIALLQSDASSDVKRGENEGRQLHHINVVRDFKTVAPAGLTGQLELQIPKGISKQQCKVVAYLQDGVSMQVTAAGATAIQ